MTFQKGNGSYVLSVSLLAQMRYVKWEMGKQIDFRLYILKTYNYCLKQLEHRFKMWDLQASKRTEMDWIVRPGRIIL